MERKEYDGWMMGRKIQTQKTNVGPTLFNLAFAFL